MATLMSFFSVLTARKKFANILYGFYKGRDMKRIFSNKYNMLPPPGFFIIYFLPRSDFHRLNSAILYSYCLIENTKISVCY